MRMRVALATLGTAMVTVVTTMVILPLAADRSGPTAVATPHASTSVPGTNFPADGTVDESIEDLVSRAYGVCRIWSKNDWPRRVASVRNNGQEYRSHGKGLSSAPTVDYAYNVFSDEEIRGDGTLEDIEIIQQSPRVGAPVSESAFYLRYRQTATADMQRYDLDGGMCR